MNASNTLSRKASANCGRIQAALGDATLRRFLELSDKVAQNDERLLTLALNHLKLLWDICPVHTGLPSYVFWDSRPLARARRLDVY